MSLPESTSYVLDQGMELNLVLFNSSSGLTSIGKQLFFGLIQPLPLLPAKSLTPGAYLDCPCIDSILRLDQA